MAAHFVNDFFVGLRPNGVHGSNGSIATATSISVPEGSSLVLIQAISKNVRVVLDGSTTATTTTGFQVAAGTPQYFPLASSKTISVIEESATATVQYQFFK